MGPVKRTLSGARDAIRIVHVTWTIDANAHSHIPAPHQIAPFRGEERAVGLEGVVDRDASRAQAFNGLKCRFVVGHGQDERFARMPDDRNLLRSVR